MNIASPTNSSSIIILVLLIVVLDNTERVLFCTGPDAIFEISLFLGLAILPETLSCRRSRKTNASSLNVASSICLVAPLS